MMATRSKHVEMTLKKVSRRRHSILGLILLYVFGTIVLRQIYAWRESAPTALSYDDSRIIRKLLSTSDDSNGTTTNTTEPCTHPSISEFPRDVFSQKQRSYGAILLHVFLALYMFLALAIVCDDYFVSSLEKICENCNLSEDVAGATFMAAGSSAPELFTAIIGVFVAKGDVGVGTIVGSAVFNILVIIALCALFAGQVVQLTWWPIFRDSLYYSVSIVALIVVMKDGVVTWYESLIMIILYFGYIILMKFNPLFVKRINRRHQLREAKQQDSDPGSKLLGPDEVSGGVGGFSVGFADGNGKPMTDVEMPELPPMKRTELSDGQRMTWKELGYMIMLSDKFPPTTRFRAACLMVIAREDRKKMLAAQREMALEAQPADERESNGGVRSPGSTGSDEEEPGTPFLYPHGSPLRVISWLFSLPLTTLMYFTIPDCRKLRWESWWPLTFVVSIIWIMVFSYIMVWMVCVIGFTLGVPDVIMGITFLAAGTSIPDAISSLLVAREGLGDMAVSNSIGSNIFDILIGLAVPWFIKSAIVDPGQVVEINSNGMVYSVALLFVSVIITLSSIAVNKWRLDRKLGVFMSVVYLLFVSLCACIEFNLFIFVNWPVCPYSW